MFLDPDLDTFGIIPWERGDTPTAKVICDVYTPDGEPFAGDPRGVLRRQLERAKELGYTYMTARAGVLHAAAAPQSAGTVSRQTVRRRMSSR